MDSDKQTVLVLGAYRQSLAVARSLGASRNVILGRTESKTYVDRSRFVCRTWQHPEIDAENPGQFLAALDVFIEQHPEITAVFPVGDSEILFLCQHRESLSKSVTWVMPTSEVVDACQQKTEMFRRVDQLSIPNAAFASVAGGAPELLSAADEIGFPCIIKPENETSRIFGKKAFIALSRQSLCERLDQFSSQLDAIPSESIVQRYYSCPRRNIYFFADHGKVQASVEIQIDRTDQWDGTGYAVEGHAVEPDHDWSNHLEALAESLNYHGAGCLQYLIDPSTGQATFLEINARLGANVACAIGCNLDLPHWWLQQSCGATPSIPEPFRSPIGRRYTWLYGDVLGLKKAISGRERSFGEIGSWIKNTIAANLRSRTHVTFQLRDPVPTLVVFAELFAGPVRRFAKRSASVAQQEEVVSVRPRVRSTISECRQS